MEAMSRERDKEREEERRKRERELSSEKMWRKKIAILSNKFTDLLEIVMNHLG